MTVKEACSVLKIAKHIDLIWAGDAVAFHKDNTLMLEAYGNYVVEQINGGVGDESYEIYLAMMPVKAGA